MKRTVIALALLPLMLDQAAGCESVAERHPDAWVVGEVTSVEARRDDRHGVVSEVTIEVFHARPSSLQGRVTVWREGGCVLGGDESMSLRERLRQPETTMTMLDEEPGGELTFPIAIGEPVAVALLSRSDGEDEGNKKWWIIDKRTVWSDRYPRTLAGDAELKRMLHSKDKWDSVTTFQSRPRSIGAAAVVQSPDTAVASGGRFTSWLFWDDALLAPTARGATLAAYIDSLEQTMREE